MQADLNVATADPTELLKRLLKRPYERLRVRIIRRNPEEKVNAPQAVRPRRSCRKWPRCRAYCRCDKVAPAHEELSA
jgi:hypothetical protein